MVSARQVLEKCDMRPNACANKPLFRPGEICIKAVYFSNQFSVDNTVDSVVSAVETRHVVVNCLDKSCVKQNQE